MNIYATPASKRKLTELFLILIFFLKFQLISFTVKQELNLLTFFIMCSGVNDLHWFCRLYWKPEQLFI